LGCKLEERTSDAQSDRLESVSSTLSFLWTESWSGSWSGSRKGSWCGGTLDTFPLFRRWTIQTNLRFIVAIVHGRRQTFIGLGTYSTWLDIRVQIMIAILTGAKVATLRVGTNGILVTVVGKAICTLILTDALSFPITLVKALLAGASPSNAQ
jgi:hypothetical protein